MLHPWGAGRRTPSHVLGGLSKKGRQVGRAPVCRQVFLRHRAHAQQYHETAELQVHKKKRFWEILVGL